MADKVPVWVKSIIRQIDEYKFHLDTINSLPVNQITEKHMELRQKYIREIDLLTQELKDEY